MTENGRWNSFLKETGHFKNQNKVSKVYKYSIFGASGFTMVKKYG